MPLPLPLVLASTSPYRRELLGRLGFPFEIANPGVDETALPGETPVQTSERLALAKARAATRHYPSALIIGSDQVACMEDRAFGKPGSRENAVAQLKLLRGRSVMFHTALCVLNSATDRVQLERVPVEVRFREIDDGEIERYLDREPALNCAGSARYEGLGICLLEHIRGDDPNALIGLPLISLCRMLRREGIPLP